MNALASCRSPFASSSKQLLKAVPRRGQKELLTKLQPAASRTFSQRRLVSTATSSVPIGIEAAVKAASDKSFQPRSTLFKNEFSLAGRVAVVTGGHRGIGLDAAEAMAEAGATVYCLDLSEKPNDTWKATQDYVRRISEIEEGIGSLKYIHADATSQKNMWDIVEGIAAKEGRLDACIAAAGTLGASDCLEYSQEDFDRVFRINVNGVMYTAQAAARAMDKREIKGSIVLVASLASVVAIRGAPCSAYASSKAAVVQLSRSLACELGPRGIRVNSLSPGYLYSECVF